MNLSTDDADVQGEIGARVFKVNWALTRCWQSACLLPSGGGSPVKDRETPTQPLVATGQDPAGGSGRAAAAT